MWISTLSDTNRVWVMAAVLASFGSPAMPQGANALNIDAGTSLRGGFYQPPNEARPLLNWVWLNGNITKEGIRKDLEWAARIGAGGVNLYEMGNTIPQVVEQRIAIGTPEWKDAVRYAGSLAANLGLELGITSSFGYSGSTGGTWVQSQDAKKKLVWSEVEVTGGRPFKGSLPLPPTTVGPYQDVPNTGDFTLMEGAAIPPIKPYYRDEAVVAFPVDTKGKLPLPELRSSSRKLLDAGVVNDYQLTTGVEIQKLDLGSPGHIDIKFDEPQTVASLTIYISDNQRYVQDFTPRLEVAEEGGKWRRIADFSLDLYPVPTTTNFAPVVGSQFRLTLVPRPEDFRYPFVPATGAVEIALFPAFSRSTVKVAELRLGSQLVINRGEAKAGFSEAADYETLDASSPPKLPAIPLQSILDITDRMGPDGRLDWVPPPGNWKVIRFGYSLTGKMIHPATQEATGLSVDPYDGEAVRRSFNTHLDLYDELLDFKSRQPSAPPFVYLDSNETLASNWTPRMREEFGKINGYDLRRWMPALAGYAIGSHQRSNEFLADFRKALSTLMEREHYGQIAHAARERGLKVYSQALECCRGTLGDDMAMRSFADAPSGAMMYFPRESQPYTQALFADLEGAASVAHIYGKKLVTAESMTSLLVPWALAPADLKRIIDLAFSHGVNRPLIYMAPHQPRDDLTPGLRFYAGSDFNRLDTWGEMARPWMDYLARTSYMLQQGRDVADVAYFYGEDTPVISVFVERPVSDVPKGYGFDFINADALLTQLSVEAGKVVSRGGARYEVLYLGGVSNRMSVPVLRRLAELVDAGGIVVGNAPVQALGLERDQAEFESLTKRLWSGDKLAAVGRGRVIAGMELSEALQLLKIKPDAHIKGANGFDIGVQHREMTAENIDLYYLSNRRYREEPIEARFRVTGRKPELWDPVTGRHEPLSYRTENGETAISLDLQPEQSVFVVFGPGAVPESLTVPKVAWRKVATIDGTWHVRFQPGRGAPQSIELPSLHSLSSVEDPGVKFFSGVATYLNAFHSPREWRPGQPLLLDLGAVGDVAEIRVNGQFVGTAWKEPYEVDIGRQARVGSNELEIRVANLWINRLIGDAQPGATKVTTTYERLYRADAPLRPSGLMGPVSLSAIQKPTR